MELRSRGPARVILLSSLLFSSAQAALAAGQLRIEVDLSDRLLSAYNGSRPVQTYSISVGADEKPTPTGSFQIKKLVWNPSWVPPDEDWARDKEPKGPADKDNPMQRVKIFFQEPDYYIHGTPDTKSMGRARSHGCLRMKPADVTALAKLVMAHGGAPRPEPWFRRILHLKQTDVVTLSNPVPMRVVE